MLKGMPGTSMADADPRSLAAAVMAAGMSELMLRDLERGAEVMQGDPQVRVDDMVRQWLASGTPGGVVMGALVAAQSSVSTSPFLRIARQSDAAADDDRRYFHRRPDRCTRVRRAYPDEHRDHGPAGPGAEYRVAVVNILGEIGMRARFLYRTAPGPQVSEHDASSPADVTRHVLGISGLPGLGMPGAEMLETAVRRSEAMLGRA